MIESIIPYIVAAIASIILYIISSKFLFKYLTKVLGREILLVLKIAIVLLSISLFLALTVYIHGIHEIFVLIFSLFIVSFIGIIVGVRHVLGEYMTGIFASKAYNLRVGDYIELDSVKGYITALTDTSIIVKDTKHNLIHIPYTMITNKPFKTIKPEEGYEVSIPVFLPYKVDLDEVVSKVKSVSKGMLDNVIVNVKAIDSKGITISIQGFTRDPRREEEIVNAILTSLYRFINASSHINNYTKDQP